MIQEQDVYIAYRKAKSLSSGKGFRPPNDWSEFFHTKLSQANQQSLGHLADMFNTKWTNIDLDGYMECGFELYKSFSYHMFTKDKIIERYIEKDKQKKRRIGTSTKAIDDSFAFIEYFMKNRELINGYNRLQSYCKIKDGHRKTILEHYMKNKVDAIVLVYCLYYKYLIPTDIEREYIYNVTNRYRELLEHMFEVEDFIKGKENELGN